MNSCFICILVGTQTNLISNALDLAEKCQYILFRWIDVVSCSCTGRQKAIMISSILALFKGLYWHNLIS